MLRHLNRPLATLIAGVFVMLICGSGEAQEAPVSRATPATPDALEEVVVTAEKRVENVQNVPIAITVLTADALQTKGIHDVAGLSNIAPNVSLDAGSPFSGSNAVLAAYIRGIGQNDFQFNEDPGVGVYVDGVYLARSVGANTNMMDVDRVEILKGPQGSLFGRNTIGGAISIATRTPGTQFMFKSEVTTGQFSRLDVRATADLPISDRILTTVTFSTASRDGYQRRIPFSATNVADGAFNNPFAYIPDCGPVGSPCSYATDSVTSFPQSGYQSADRQGGQNQQNARAKVLILLSDSVKLTLTGDWTHVNEPAQANSILAIDPSVVQFGMFYNGCLAAGTPIPGGIPAGVPPAQLVCGPRGGLSPTINPYRALPGLANVNNDGNPYNNVLPYDNRFMTGDIDTTYATGNNFSKLRNLGGASTLDWSFTDSLRLKWINAYRDLTWSAGTDSGGSPDTILATSFGMQQHQVSEELQLTGEAIDNRLNFVVGGYYFREAGHLEDLVTFPAGLLVIDSVNDVTTTAAALYTHLDFKLTDSFSLIAGARYTHENKSFQGHQADDNGFTYKISGCSPPTAPSPVAGLDCQQMLGFPSAAEPYRFYPPGIQHQTFSNTSPNFGAQYRIDNSAMVYASYSKGYKTGSWTTRLSSPYPVYSPSLSFGPEFATAEELGLKAEWLDHRLLTNLAAFHTKYDGIQLSSQVGISPTTVNAGDARIYGAELEAEMLIGGGLSFSSSLGYTNARYTRLNNVSDNGLPLTLTSCPERTSDPNHQCDLPKTPEWKYYLGPQYVFPLANGAAVQLNADWTYTAKIANDFGNTQLLRRPSVNMVNASVTYKAPSAQWEVSAGGTNLTDKRYLMSGFNQGGIAEIFGTYNAPREWFATFRFTPQAGGT